MIIANGLKGTHFDFKDLGFRCNVYSSSMKSEIVLNVKTLAHEAKAIKDLAGTCYLSRHVNLCVNK